jgi:hypothetical protein
VVVGLAAEVAMKNIESGSRDELLFDLVFALKRHVAPDHLRAIARRRPPPPGRMEDLEERIVAEALLEHLVRCGWDITKRPGFGSKCPTTPGGPGRSA